MKRQVGLLALLTPVPASLIGIAPGAGGNLDQQQTHDPRNTVRR